MLNRFLSAMILSILMLGVTSLSAAQKTQTNKNMSDSSKVQWYTNYSQAVQAAKKERKPMLLFFTGSDWCGWCKKMDQEIFSSPQFAQQVGNKFIFVDVDFPMNKKLPADEAQQNAQLKQKYAISGYPTVIVLDSNENFIAETGYRPGGGKSYADYLMQLIQ